MATNVHAKLLPGVTAREVARTGPELRRDAVFLHNEWIGDVVYACDGWRWSKDAASQPVCRVSAIRRLPSLALVAV